MDILEIKVDQSLPERIHKPTNVSLFLYNAAIWNPHRIHYDETYTKKFEGHPKLVIDGPLMGDWMAQCVSNWLNERGKICEFEYRNIQTAYLGDTLTSGGKVLSRVENKKVLMIDLWIRNSDENKVASGSAKINLNSR